MNKVHHFYGTPKLRKLCIFTTCIVVWSLALKIFRCNCNGFSTQKKWGMCIFCWARSPLEIISFNFTENRLSVLSFFSVVIRMWSFMIFLVVLTEFWFMSVYESCVVYFVHYRLVYVCGEWCMWCMFLCCVFWWSLLSVFFIFCLHFSVMRVQSSPFLPPPSTTFESKQR